MEWLEYHRLVGVDHFFLYDTAHSSTSSVHNNTNHNVSSSSSSSSSSSQSSSSSSSSLSSTGSGSGGSMPSLVGHNLRDMLRDYLALGLVTIVPWHHSPPPPPSPSPRDHATKTTPSQETIQRENSQIERIKTLAVTSCYTR